MASLSLCPEAVWVVKGFRRLESEQPDPSLLRGLGSIIGRGLLVHPPLSSDPKFIRPPELHLRQSLCNLDRCFAVILI